MVSATTQLRLKAADGKRYLSDVLDADGVIALADRIDDREMFMKGIDYSYYYEEPE